jgi:hypothetical protein
VSATTAHRARWYGVAYDRVAGHAYRTPRTSHMNDADWGWDAVCSCGYDTRTGGALAIRVREMLAEHRADVKYDADRLRRLADLGLDDDGYRSASDGNGYVYSGPVVTE